MDAVLAFVMGLPPALILTALAAGSALENLLPPVPADTFILLGGFLAGRGHLDPWLVFAATWSANVGSALGVYWMGHRYGRSFFEVGMGRHVLTAHQLDRMRHFYARWGTSAIFLTRFLPGLRAVVPAFAGISHRPFLPVAVPVAVASAIWYGALVWIGATTARNLATILGWLDSANRWLLGAAVALGLAVALWWWRSRHPAERPERRAGTAEDEEGS